MFDLHYDLLTYIYMNKENLNPVKSHLKKIFNNNITGGIFNLFYMSRKEMKDELGIDNSKINIIENLREVTKLISDNNLIPKHIKYIYGIEGLDYLERLEDLDEIYDLGVRSVNVVWNNDNKFGGGAKGDETRGLTSLGEKLIERLVEKKIAIDLSHTNEKTFYNIAEVCKSLKLKGKNPIIFASHSNAFGICNHSRNLRDKQILKIKELGGVVGIVGVKPFCIKEKKFENDSFKYKKIYLNHIRYMRKILGDIQNIAVSTDDMTYYKINKEYYKYFNVFNQETIKKELKILLLDNSFTEYEIENILYNNFKNKILQRL